MRFMNVWQYRNERAKNLPYGNQRQVEIAWALATNPKLLLFDEPSLGLAPLLVRAIFDTVARDQSVGHDDPVGGTECPRGVEAGAQRL